MIKIQIGSDERRYEDASEQWITQQLRRRREDNVSTCVTVTINEPPLNMTLQTPGCSAGHGGGGRAPNDQERRIFDLWARLGLNEPNFTGGNIIAFVKQLRR